MNRLYKFRDLFNNFLCFQIYSVIFRLCVSQEIIILKPGVVIGSNNQPSIGIFKINTDPPFLTPTPGWGRQRGHLATGRRRQRSHLAGGDDFDC